ncbi:MAG: Fic family protein [Lacisediminimonas sp.]|nr:Fic family protein [Lacisediminimonas sp.]
MRVTSRAGMRRHTTVENGYVTEVLTQNASPNGVRGHLTFALKHEGVALELLSRLFAVLDPAELLAWIAAEPTGEYARRTCFLYEWITGNELDHGDAIARGNYVNVIDDERYLTSTQPELNRRWRVRNNLPGTPAYCPTVFRTERVKQAERYDCAGQMAALQAEFGEDLLMRSAVWLTLKESRSSFAIEHAESQKDRIQRFAAVMAERCGFYDSPLDPDALATLQSEILGDAAIRFGLRQSPVFVGSVVRFAHVVHYIAPQAADVASLLGGLAAFERCTRGRSPIVRAAALSFGFVYIHPLADGNGRISRFLVNDVLRRDQAIALPLILPISATITESAAARAGYDRVLEQFSRPFMHRYASAYRFGDRVMYDDGVLSDLEFSQYQDALHSWRFPDLTSHAEYLADVIEETVRVEMRSEAKLLRRHDSARAAIKDVVEIPNTNLDRIIQSLIQNDYRVSGKLKNTFPMITERSGLWEQITQAVRDAMIDDASMQADPGGE